MRARGRADDSRCEQSLARPPRSGCSCAMAPRPPTRLVADTAGRVLRPIGAIGAPLDILRQPSADTFGPTYPSRTVSTALRAVLYPSLLDTHRRPARPRSAVAVLVLRSEHSQAPQRGKGSLFRLRLPPSRRQLHGGCFRHPRWRLRLVTHPTCDTEPSTWAVRPYLEPSSSRCSGARARARAVTGA